nr:Chain I, fibrin beta chain peptide ligand fragment Gly-His-Arg-Pro-Leu-Asp-Lys [synthetic construct]1N86_J Chain J, fibrin beta chain peptide ligand fragment Gly-His-Arg-Pro-Leu-Asp-Lys [synthetic construct]
GHRPLDK